ncbi:hypothetical protein PsYK624_135740 [Phanerochaete sordida]|uniref:ZZ-type domain-containing protein n=1 Tax=Phanerochaete sordida TaxID=48140 RepID=A0A9P3GLX0_9APHY|nr:hypothetical protein PsYK624_135740 [Phanerochaete sordida]
MANVYSPFHEAVAGAQEVLIDTGKARGKSQLERGLNSIDDTFAELSDSSNSQMAAPISDMATEAWRAVQPQLSGWLQHYEVVETALNVIKDIHPAIALVVIAFKAAFKLERTRRENDEKILMIRVSMIETMEELLCLEEAMSVNLDGLHSRVERHLEPVVKDIAQTIKECATKCDSFANCNVLVRALKSVYWAQKLTDYFNKFVDLRDKLRSSLQLVMAHDVRSTASKISLLSTKVDGLLEHLERRSVAEQQAYDQWESISKDESDGSEKRNTLIERCASEDISNLLTQGDSRSVEAMKTDAISKIKSEIDMPIDTMLQNLNNESTRKFNALIDQVLDDFGRTVKRDGDRVINSILSGPQDNIRDPGVWKVWSDMGWRRCTEPRLLVKALREYYAEVYHALCAGDDDAGLIAVETHDKTIAFGKMARVFSLEDAWTLRYISMPRVQPLLGMLDPDWSSWVTVEEVNRFALARPKDWSFPHWMAYWTLGHTISTAHYLDQIQKVLVQMYQAWKSVHPVNQVYVDTFMDLYASKYGLLHRILAGAYISAQKVSYDYMLLHRFESYISQKEDRLRSFLEKINYYFDAQNTVTLLLGVDQLDQHLLPIIFLMASRYLEVMRLACKFELDSQELRDMLISHIRLMKAVEDRIERIIQDICGVNDLSVEDTLDKCASGLYSYLSPSLDIKKYRESEYFIQLHTKNSVAPILHTRYPASGQMPVVGTPNTRDGQTSLLRHCFQPASSLRYEEVPPEHVKRYIELRSRVLDKEMGGIGSWNIYSQLRPLERREVLELGRLALQFTPRDAHLHESLAHQLMRRQVVHFCGCDGCDEYPLRRTRVICLDCTRWVLANKDPYNSADMCAKCTGNGIMKFSRFNIMHDGTHRLAQTRRQLAIQAPFSIEQLVRILLERIDTLLVEGRPRPSNRCAGCRRSVTIPYWHCIDCSDDVDICQDCNLRDEKEHENLYPGWPGESTRIDSPSAEDSEHKWNHFLILCQSRPTMVPADEDVQAERSDSDRLKAVEERTQQIDDRTQAVEQRVQRIEERVQRVEDLLTQMNRLLVQISNRLPPTPKAAARSVEGLDKAAI